MKSRNRITGFNGLKPVYVRGRWVNFSNNNGANHQGGTCYGDFGGSWLVEDTDRIVAVTSGGGTGRCIGADLAFRLDQPDVLEWLAQWP